VIYHLLRFPCLWTPKTQGFARAYRIFAFSLFMDCKKSGFLWTPKIHPFLWSEKTPVLATNHGAGSGKGCAF
jgi:hypothetical protein